MQQVWRSPAFGGRVCVFVCLPSTVLASPAGTHLPAWGEAKGAEGGPKELQGDAASCLHRPGLCITLSRCRLHVMYGTTTRGASRSRPHSPPCPRLLRLPEAPPHPPSSALQPAKAPQADSQPFDPPTPSVQAQDPTPPPASQAARVPGPCPIIRPQELRTVIGTRNLSIVFTSTSVRPRLLGSAPRRSCTPLPHACCSHGRTNRGAQPRRRAHPGASAQAHTPGKLRV